ncbi:MAG: isoleucine--tRNA ligase [Salibacter sp.]|uniref:isoleucine--tRNA ligase n=1 Tax=Salibacter sp. TaxID=2010995 RepID=UPI00286FB84B|nr:isoleucine--tRNA ligase [Salibacter sp.]MDR9397461.1 isoleucine--tRNA ligase [Salibacter sp.]
MAKFNEYKQLNLTEVADEINEFWKNNRIFEKSVEERSGSEPFVFYEGPPSANGKPGIHHVMARTIKDLFCRYQTMKGKQVKRKAGWDTHGLPVELGVEKELGINKEDIGDKISIADYNKACREAVMRYTDIWNNLTEKMGYWVDMDDPYITYKTKYIETVWWLLKQFHEKNLLYKGYTIQPYSPKAGTGLSSHELNMPGCYRDVKDTTIIAQFKVADSTFKVPALKAAYEEGNLYLLAWTTTPWTLPSNTALTVGEKIDYVLVRTFNQYTHEPIFIVLAKDLVKNVLGKKFQQVDTLEGVVAFQKGDKKIPFYIAESFKGKDLVGTNYEQLLPYAKPMENPDDAFRVIPGDFVTTEDGTGIVHTAPTFGADDARVAKEAGVPPMLVEDKNGNPSPLVDLQGKFLETVKDDVFGIGGEYVKEEYLTDEEKEEALKKQQTDLKDVIKNIDKYLSVDERISIKLKMEGLAFNVEKYTHSYPHCWRTDKPVLYYPLDSWFIRSTEMKDQMIGLNKTINWKPKATGEGRFGNWLENLNDWNLSRSRYWGIPLPVWTTEEGDEVKVVGSVEELKDEIDKAVEAGVMDNNPLADFKPGNMDESNYDQIDLHRPYVDDVKLVSKSGETMTREKDLIDVWFDSGSMPYAQHHYPFENKEAIDQNQSYPADFIAEGVDQTRGWFFTLHAIGSMIFDSVAYKNVVSNGLVLDKNGQKMSKRLGNAVEPFEAMEKYGTDAIRWYMITNAQPWDNLKFDLEGVNEVKRKFFRALQNTYAFFSLYANVDGFTFSEDKIDIKDRPEIDRWVISKLNSLIKEVDAAYADYEPTKAGRLIQEFVVENLSNWHVRLSRKRFWRGDYGQDKIAAYQTLYECLTAVAKLAAPIAPFYAEQLYRDLNSVTSKEDQESVHLAFMPEVVESEIDTDLEERMSIAQQVSSMILALRKKESIKVRQPLQKIMVPVLNDTFERQLSDVANLIKTETNIKEIEFLNDTKGVLVKQIKPDFKALGPKYGKLMKGIAAAVNQFEQEDINELERNGQIQIEVQGENVTLTIDDVEISTDDIPGWLVMTENGITVALDIQLNDELRHEGITRELVNRIQNLRKDSGLDVTDRIEITVESQELLTAAVNDNFDYICAETLADELNFVDSLSGDNVHESELNEDLTCKFKIERT